ncbi:MAG: hypothetical protein ACREBR_05175 [bacterium]
MEQPVYIPCSECDYGDENLINMVQHILEAHPEYTPEEAEHYAQVWQEGAYEQQDLWNIERAEEFRRTGHDPYRERDDNEHGK